MTARACPAPAEDEFSACMAADPFVLAQANINPLTGLSTDYLNHFNEAIMLLEMLPSMPECREDLAAWRPLDYHEHFSRSQLTQRELAIAAYDLAAPRIRRQFDALCSAMNAAVLSVQAVVPADPAADDVPRITRTATSELKQLIALASAVIHGHELTGSAASIQESQAAIDAILQP